MEDIKLTSVRLTPETEQRLEDLCRITKRTKSSYIKEALDQYLDDLEDAYTALSRVAEPKAEYLTSTELKKRLKPKDA